MSSGPLEGFAVGITADRRAAEQAMMLSGRGARVVLGPSLRVLPLAGGGGLRSATEDLVSHPPGVVVSSTGIGIRNWLDAAASWRLDGPLLDALRSARLLARGPKAAGALVSAGLRVDWQAPSERLDDLLRHLLGSAIAGERVAIQLDGGLDPGPGKYLSEVGCDVVEVPVYRWTVPEDEQPVHRLIEQVCAGHLDAVTFTSAPAVRNLVALAREWGVVDDLLAAFGEKVLAVCVGPVCAEAAEAAGIERAVQPDRARLGAMVATLTTTLSGSRRSFSVAGHHVALQGSRLVVDGKATLLTNREREVLDVLSRRPGTVVGKRQLLAEVWGTAQADPHALEVAVARLRQRLGAAAPGLQTVVRRGYRLDAVSGQPLACG